MIVVLVPREKKKKTLLPSLLLSMESETRREKKAHTEARSFLGRGRAAQGRRDFDWRETMKKKRMKSEKDADAQNKKKEISRKERDAKTMRKKKHNRQKKKKILVHYLLLPP